MEKEPIINSEEGKLSDAAEYKPETQEKSELLMPTDEQLRMLDEMKREEMEEKHPGLSPEELRARIGKEEFEKRYGPLREFVDNDKAEAHDKREKSEHERILDEATRRAKLSLLEKIQNPPQHVRTNKWENKISTEKPTEFNQMLNYNEAQANIERLLRVIDENFKKFDNLRFYQLIEKGKLIQSRKSLVDEAWRWDRIRERADTFLAERGLEPKVDGHYYSDDQLQKADNTPL